MRSQTMRTEVDKKKTKQNPENLKRSEDFFTLPLRSQHFGVFFFSIAGDTKLMKIR